MTPEQAYNEGWDYPPKMGVFGIVSPRKCGNCCIKDTLRWALAIEKKSIEDLNENQLIILSRILHEPENIIP